MKRSNRLILLIGIFLAVIAFIGVFMLLQQNEQGDQGRDRQTTMTVFATKDIPLGAEVTADSVRQEEYNNTQRAADAFSDVSLVIGKTARTNIASGAQLTAAMFTSGAGITEITVPPTRRAISVQVDQVSGVGTLIKAGDYVDMVVGFTADKFPVVTVDPATDLVTPIAGLNATTVKVLLQGMQVLGTLLPPPPAEATDGETTGEAPVTLTGQQEIVILDVSAQQAEIIKFAQMDGSVSLVLRSSKDFQDPNDPTISVTPLPDVTTGIILKILVDEYGVLVPQVVEALLPTQTTP